MGVGVTRLWLSGRRNAVMKTYESASPRQRRQLCPADRRNSKVAANCRWSIIFLAQAGVGPIDNTAAIYGVNPYYNWLFYRDMGC